MSDEDMLAEEFYLMMCNNSRLQVSRFASESANGLFGVLGQLAFVQDGIAPGALRDALGVGSGRMADILRVLESKDYIERKTDSSDGRKVSVFITVKGRQVVMEKKNEIKKFMNGLMDYLGPTDSAQLVRIMGKVAEYGNTEKNNEK